MHIAKSYDNSICFSNLIQCVNYCMLIILFFSQNSDSAPITPKAKQNEYVEDRLTNGHVNGPVGGGNITSAYTSIGSLDSGDLIQFAWQIASGMV